LIDYLINKFNCKTPIQFSCMFQVKLMHPEDFSFATELANTMNWNMAIEDFEFITKLEPEGCFVLFKGSKPQGIATCINYGKVGWFGNLIVKEEIRHKGAGKLLVKHAIDYLQDKGVETIGLYAYPNLLDFYKNVGFKTDETFTVLYAPTLNSLPKVTLPEIGKHNFQTIAKFDKECFGGDRTKLLESILFEDNNLGFYISEGNEVVGYVAATVYPTMTWIGPLTCQEGNLDAAAKLVKAVLAKLTGQSIYAALPKKETFLQRMLFSVGFQEDFSVVRMFFGSVTARNCIYLAESLERG
jgi:GNAT superfamily N-acetyltransferase